MTEENDLIALRREQLQQLRETGTAFRNDFRRDSLSEQLLARYGDKSKEELESETVRVAVAGRMMSRRIMGKASFCDVQDRSGRIQLFVQRDSLPEGVYNEQFKKWDIGDILGAEGAQRFHPSRR